MESSRFAVFKISTILSLFAASMLVLMSALSLHLKTARPVPDSSFCVENALHFAYNSANFDSSSETSTSGSASSDNGTTEEVDKW